MYRGGPTIYHDSTSACVGDVIDRNGKCLTCNERAHISVITSTADCENVVQVHHFRITVVMGPKDIEDFKGSEEPEPWRPRRDLVMKAPPSRVKDDWKGKWRPRQQRPRDGLR